MLSSCVSRRRGEVGWWGVFNKLNSVQKTLANENLGISKQVDLSEKEKEMFPREIQTNQINRNHSRIWNCIYCYIFQIKPHFHVLSYLSSGLNYLFFSPATESLSMQSPYPNLRKALVGYLEKTCFFSSVFEIKLRTIKE